MLKAYQMEFLTQTQRKLKKLWKFGRTAMSDWIKDTLYDNGVMKNKQNYI